jgi:hypothetical protein
VAYYHTTIHTHVADRPLDWTPTDFCAFGLFQCSGFGTAVLSAAFVSHGLLYARLDSHGLLVNSFQRSLWRLHYHTAIYSRGPCCLLQLPRTIFVGFTWTIVHSDQTPRTLAPSLYQLALWPPLLISCCISCMLIDSLFTWSHVDRIGPTTTDS